MALFIPPISLQNSPKIGILGGSFNPAHQGHLDISLYCLKHFDLDEIWWIISPHNPLKDKNELQDFEERLVYAKKLVKTHKKIKISDFEQVHNSQYTYETLCLLIEKYPNTHFTWIMGADNLAGFHQWRNWKKIFNLLPIIVVSRPKYQSKALKSTAALEFAEFRLENVKQARMIALLPPPAWVFCQDLKINLSATKIRKNRAINLKNVS